MLKIRRDLRNVGAGGGKKRFRRGLCSNVRGHGKKTERSLRSGKHETEKAASRPSRKKPSSPRKGANDRGREIESKDWDVAGVGPGGTVTKRWTKN